MPKTSAFTPQITSPTRRDSSNSPINGYEKKRKRPEASSRTESRLQELIDEYKKTIQALDVSSEALVDNPGRLVTEDRGLTGTQLTENHRMLTGSALLPHINIFSNRALSPTLELPERMPIDVETQLDLAKDQIRTLRDTNERLEKSLRIARDREDKLRSHLHKLNETKSRTELRLQRSTDERDNLQNEVDSLATLSSRLASDLQEHQLKLVNFESERNTLNTKIEALQTERMDLNQQLQDAQEEVLQFYKLNDERQEHIDQIMQQAVSVESDLKAAFERIDTIATEYASQKDGTDSLNQAKTAYQRQLSAAQFKLTLAITAEASHKSQVDILKEREASLQKQIDGLKDENLALSREAVSTKFEMEKTDKTLQELVIELEASKRQTVILRKQADAARRRSVDLENQLQQYHSETHQAYEEMQELDYRLSEISEENTRLQTQLRASQHSLDTAIEENIRLGDVVEKQEIDLKSVEHAMAKLDNDIKDVVYKVERPEVQTPESSSEKELVAKKVDMFETEVDRLADANNLLQGVLNALSSGLRNGMHSEAYLKLKDQVSPPEPETTETELDDLKFLLADELVKLQETKTMLDNIVSKLLQTRSNEQRPPSKQDSAIDVDGPMTPSPDAQTDFSESGRPSRESIKRSMRSLRRGDSVTSTERSPSLSYRGGSAGLFKRRPSWSSSDSSFSARRLHHDNSPSPISVTTTWTTSVTTPEDTDTKPRVEVRIFADHPPNPERRPSNRLRKYSGSDGRPSSSRDGSFESSKLRYRSSPNLRRDDSSEVRGSLDYFDSTTVSRSGSVTASPSRTNSLNEHCSINDGSVVRGSIDSARSTAQSHHEVQLPRRVSQLGIKKAKLRKLNSSMDLHKNNTSPNGLLAYHPNVSVPVIRTSFIVANGSENGSSMEQHMAAGLPSPGFRSLRLSMERGGGGLRSPVRAEGFVGYDNGLVVPTQENVRHGKRGWVTNMVNRLKKR